MLDVSLSTEGVWSELRGNIRGFVGRRVRRPADVDDIVQRVFLQVHRALPTLRDADRLHAWIYQTTRRAIADYYRAPSHTREVPAGAAVDLAPQAAEAPADDADGTALQELSACLRPLISSLGPADQEALHLVEFEGVTQVEAARRLGLSVSGMKSRVQRARLHLRTALDECCRIALDRRGGLIGYEARPDQCGTCQGGCDTAGSGSSSNSRPGPVIDPPGA
jgi:RNA polymerase sigma-70 factor (ECF subfamily)